MSMSYHAKVGLKAAQRAAQKVAEEAHRENRAIPIWKNGKIVFEVPPLLSQQDLDLPNQHFLD